MARAHDAPRGGSTQCRWARSTSPPSYWHCVCASSRAGRVSVCVFGRVSTFCPETPNQFVHKRAIWNSLALLFVRACASGHVFSPHPDTTLPYFPCCSSRDVAGREKQEEQEKSIFAVSGVSGTCVPTSPCTPPQPSARTSSSRATHSLLYILPLLVLVLPVTLIQGQQKLSQLEALPFGPADPRLPVAPAHRILHLLRIPVHSFEG